MLLNNLAPTIEGYFWKRKSLYFDKKDNLKTTFLSGLLSKVKLKIAKYDRRYFKLDIQDFVFSYAKDPASLATPNYCTSLRNLVSVKRNIVTMPEEDEEGNIQYKEMNILETTHEIDRGPNEACQNVFELKVADRMFTLYTTDNIMMEKFVLYFEKIIELKMQVLHV